jgi:hypothetical protein
MILVARATLPGIPALPSSASGEVSLISEPHVSQKRCSVDVNSVAYAGNVEWLVLDAYDASKSNANGEVGSCSEASEA